MYLKKVLENKLQVLNFLITLTLTVSAGCLYIFRTPGTGYGIPEALMIVSGVCFIYSIFAALFFFSYREQNKKIVVACWMNIFAVVSPFLMWCLLYLDILPVGGGDHMGLAIVFLLFISAFGSIVISFLLFLLGFFLSKNLNTQN